MKDSKEACIQRDDYNGGFIQGENGVSVLNMAGKVGM